MPANYNNSAWFYDRLSRLVYGRALINAQVYLLQFIPADTNILIVGGGTGWILEELTKIHPSGLTITYVDVAPKMISLSKKRTTGSNNVSFINAAIENVTLPANYDVAMTPFFFDNFTNESLQKLFMSIDTLLKPGGMWLNSSFQLTGKWWQYVLLKSMFLFFSVICRIEALKLPEIAKQFEKFDYHGITRQTFFRDFVISAAFIKSGVRREE